MKKYHVECSSEMYLQIFWQSSLTKWSLIPLPLSVGHFLWKGYCRMVYDFQGYFTKDIMFPPCWTYRLAHSEESQLPRHKDTKKPCGEAPGARNWGLLSHVREPYRKWILQSQQNLQMTNILDCHLMRDLRQNHPAKTLTNYWLKNYKITSVCYFKILHAR